MNKRFIIKLLIATTAIVLAAVIAFFAGLAYVMNAAPGTERGKVVRFNVRGGEPFSSVTRRLEGEGLIIHRDAIDFYAEMMRYDRRLQTGIYEYTVGERPGDIIERMMKGDVLKATVTVPEGITIRQIAGLMNNIAGIDSTAFISITRDSAVLNENGIGVETLEGYLFPDTYIIPYGMTAGDVVALMTSRMNVVFDDTLENRMKGMRLERHEVLTLASIIEAEARLARERSLISAVYHNRLKRRMKLEADPTVAYAMGEYKGRLFQKHLLTESPYNTYLHRGLPPGPICNPGEASIEAALYPDSACKALYFVASGDGGHVFSVSLKEHLSAIRDIKKRNGSK
jgi:UPF0755 protein